MRVAAHRFASRPDDLVRTLEEAAVRDDDAERRSRRLTWIAAGCALLGLLSSCAVDFSGGFGVLALVCFLAFVAVLVQRSRHQQHDLDDRKLDGTLHLMKMLKADIPRAQQVALLVDFREAKSGQPVKKTGGWTGPKEAVYEQRWLDLRTPLADGNVLHLVVTEAVTRKETPKRKYTKVKEKVQSRATLVLRLDKRYGSAEAASRVLARELRPWSVRRVQARGRVLKATLVSPRAYLVTNRRTADSRLGFELLASGESLVAVLRWAYRGLAQAQRAA